MLLVACQRCKCSNFTHTKVCTTPLRIFVMFLSFSLEVHRHCSKFMEDGTFMNDKWPLQF